MNNFQYFVPFSHPGAVFGGVLERLSTEVDQTFLKVHAKNLVKVTGTAEVKGRKRPPT